MRTFLELAKYKLFILPLDMVELLHNHFNVSIFYKSKYSGKRLTELLQCFKPKGFLKI